MKTHALLAADEHAIAYMDVPGCTLYVDYREDGTIEIRSSPFPIDGDPDIAPDSEDPLLGLDGTGEVEWIDAAAATGPGIPFIDDFPLKHPIELHNGGDGDDVLVGGMGRDYMSAAGGDDVVRGGRGADHLSGGDGDDVLRGGRGDDQLTGDKGADRFVFNDGFGDDVVTDFQAGRAGEVIDLSGVEGIVDFDDLLAGHASQVGDDVVIDDLAGNTITLTGVNLAALDAGDFIF